MKIKRYAKKLKKTFTSKTMQAVSNAANIAGGVGGTVAGIVLWRGRRL